MTSPWKNEDDIKAELRVLTEELRRLREELRSMVTPAKPRPSHAFLQRQFWPVPRPPQAVPPATANETPKRPRRRKARR